jgi:hypothetical protein
MAQLLNISTAKPYLNPEIFHELQHLSSIINFHQALDDAAEAVLQRGKCLQATKVMMTKDNMDSCKRQEWAKHPHIYQP